MTRRQIMTPLAAVCLAAACASTEYTSTTTTSQHVETIVETGSQPQFVHCVFFTLKPDVRDDEIEELIRDCYLLKSIPAVRKLDAGRRDERMQRDVNVTDYHVGLVIYFDDKAGHDAYSAHPTHDKLVAKYKDKWQQVRVFDFTAR